MKLKVPKTNQQCIREGEILSIVIPVRAPNDRISDSYVGNGAIKKVFIKPGDPLLTVIF